MHFQRLEDLRVDADKTQQEIADVLHCKREVYRRYETGIHELPVRALIQDGDIVSMYDLEFEYQR